MSEPNKTKLEIAKNAIIATNELVLNVTNLLHTCESELGQDYGLYQVCCLLRLTLAELSEQAFFMQFQKP